MDTRIHLPCYTTIDYFSHRQQVTYQHINIHAVERDIPSVNGKAALDVSPISTTRVNRAKTPNAYCRDEIYVEITPNLVKPLITLYIPQTCGFETVDGSPCDYGRQCEICANYHTEYVFNLDKIRLNVTARISHKAMKHVLRHVTSRDFIQAFSCAKIMIDGTFNRALIQHVYRGSTAAPLNSLVSPGKRTTAAQTCSYFSEAVLINKFAAMVSSCHGLRDDNVECELRVLPIVYNKRLCLNISMVFPGAEPLTGFAIV